MQIGKGALAAAVARLSEKGLLLKMERGKYRLVNRLFNEFVVRQ
jgi:predicted transcriptional regulator of viral defense system